MATIKSFTSLEQSKKLAEILPIESADMTYCAITEGMRDNMIIKDWEVIIGLDTAIKDNLFSYRNGYTVPCWSLAALLDYLSANFHVDIKYLDNYWELDCRVQVTYNKELIDACYEMILKLNELNLFYCDYEKRK